MPNLTILPPLAGIRRFLGWQQSQPFTSPDMVNMVPFNPRDGRAVLSARPFMTPFTSPNDNINLMEMISGDNPGNPSTTAVVAGDGNLWFWNGTGWTAATVDSGETITTGRPVFGTPFYRRLFIANDEADGGMLEYDYNTNTLSTPTPTLGTFPADARVVATHLGTLWSAGSETNGHILRGSRTGDPFDWDFTAEDEGAAFQTTGNNAGLINEPITALIPIKSDVLVVSSESSMSVMLGHPSRGGLFFPLSDTLGVIGPGAWAKTFDGRILAMSRKGLIQITAEGDGAASLISEQVIPNSLKGIPFDRLNPTISLAGDTRWNGVHIVVNDADNPQAWWYDLNHGAFFRWTFSDNLPRRLLQFDNIADFTKSDVLYGGTGFGGIARLESDGTEANRPQAWAFLGPVRLHGDAGPQTKSKIQRAKVTLSNDTDFSKGVVSIFVGTDAEDAFIRAFNSVLGSSAAVKTDTLRNNNGLFLPRLGGSAAVVLLGDEGTGKFGFESLDLEIMPFGRNRTPKVTGLTYDLEFGLNSFSPDFSTEAETGYALMDPKLALATSVVDSPNFIDLSLMPARWWRGIASGSNGEEIKVTDNSNNRLPAHIIRFDRANETGLLATKLTQDGDTPIRVWTKTSQTAFPAVGDTYGQFNAYASWVQFLWPSGGGTDVTSNQLDHTDLQARVSGTLEAGAGFEASTYDDDSLFPVDVALSAAPPNSDQAVVQLARVLDGGQVSEPELRFGLRFNGSRSGDDIFIYRARRIFDFQGTTDDLFTADLIGNGVFELQQPIDSQTAFHQDFGFQANILKFAAGTVDEMTLDTPIGDLVESSFGGTSPVFDQANNYVARVTVVHDNDDTSTTAGSMLHWITPGDAAQLKAYLNMLHAVLAGDFWKSPAFFPEDESVIVE